MGMDVYKEGKLIHTTDKARKALVEKVQASVRSDPTVPMIAKRTQLSSATGNLVGPGESFMAFGGEADELERKGLAQRDLSKIAKPAPEPDPEIESEPDEETAPEPEPAPSRRKVAYPSKRKAK